MTELVLSIFDPNTLLPHRAGIAGLALALSAIAPTHAFVQWEVMEDTVKLRWEGSDLEAIKWLLEQTYRSDQGYLEVPALKLDEQGRYIFTEGVMSTFLQHSKQRNREKAVPLTFLVEDDKPEIRIDYRPVIDCYYTRDFKEAFNSKGTFKPEIPLKGHHLPGLVECFVNGAYVESPTGFLALLFLPLACGYYQLPGYRSALVIPEVRNLKEWVNLRRKMPGRTYRSFRSSSAGESALHFLLQEKLVEDSQQFRIDYCEVYQLGNQPWDNNQSYLKQAVYRVQVSDQVLGLYEVAARLLPPRVKLKQDGNGTWLAESKVLAWISDNLIANKVWYSGFFEFRKATTIYPEDRRGLVVMSEHLTPDEQVLFNAVQGAFSAYLHDQIQQAQKQGRPLDYGQVTDKVIYRFQRPGTQQQFATALVKFMSDFRSSAARGAGLQISSWLHREENWRKARDLTLLAIATYKGKSKEEETMIEEQATLETANVL